MFLWLNLEQYEIEIVYVCDDKYKFDTNKRNKKEK